MSSAEITLGKLSGIEAGRGGFATVYRVSDPEHNTYALKLVDADADPAIVDSMYHEFTVGSELVHPQIVRVHHFGQHDHRPYVLFEWIEGVSFFDGFPSPTPADFVHLMHELVKVLCYLHHRGWVHGDLKPENFLWRKPDAMSSAQPAAKHAPSLCVLDLGLARPVGDDSRPRGAGTVGYAAPEFLTGQPADGRADWYSIGVVLYEWVFGQRPYVADDPAVEIAGHLEGTADFNLQRVRPVPDWAIGLISRLLAKTADERGEDEQAIFSQIAEQIPECDPAVLLNESLRWHAASESLRLRQVECELLRQIEHDIANGLPARWAVYTHGTTSESLTKRAAGLFSRLGYEVTTSGGQQERSVRVADTVSDIANARINISLHRDLVFAHNAIVEDAHLCRATMLPWDRDEVKSYLHGVVGDEDVAAAWVDCVFDATCGLPAAVSDLIAYLVSAGYLSVDSDGWYLDEDAVTDWSHRYIEHYISECGWGLDPNQFNVCEWLALAEGLGSSEILHSVCSGAADQLHQAIDTLMNRGVVVQANPSDGPLDLRLRLHGHDMILRRRLSEGDLQNRSRCLADAIATSVAEHPQRSYVLSHVYFRAAMWEQAVDAALATATAAIGSEDRDRAMLYIHAAQNAARQIADEHARSHRLGQARMVEGDLQKSAGQLDDARTTYRELLALSRKTGDVRLLAETLHDLGDLYRIMRLYDKGLRAERRARRIWETLGDRAELSRSLNSLGNLHRIAADYPRALEFYAKAIEIQRELGLEKLAAINLNNIGIIHWLQYDFVEADRIFQEALAIHERLNATVEVARVLNNLGAIGFVQGRLPEAHDYFLRAAQLNADSGAQSEELFNRWNLVEVALEAGDLRTAVGTGESVFRACMGIGELATAAEVAALLSDSYARVGDERRSRSYYQESRGLAAALKNDDLQLHLDLNLVARHIRFKQFDAAHALLDSVAPMGGTPGNRYRYVDALILRAQLAIVTGNMAVIPDIWHSGATEADAICAPHKRAQLASVCATASAAVQMSDEWAAEVMAFLDERPRWNWAQQFQLHVVRLKMEERHFQQAIEGLEAVVLQLRQAGCGELLWRALVLQGEFYHNLADYEPAMRALEEAERVLKFVASTVDEETERHAYLDCDDARTLQRIQERITQLVS